MTVFPHVRLNKTEWVLISDRSCAFQGQENDYEVIEADSQPTDLSLQGKMMKAGDLYSFCKSTGDLYGKSDSGTLMVVEV